MHRLYQSGVQESCIMIGSKAVGLKHSSADSLRPRRGSEANLGGEHDAGNAAGVGESTPGHL